MNEPDWTAVKDVLPLKACAGCGKPADTNTTPGGRVVHIEVWDHPFCYPCAAEWNVHAPTYGDIEAKYGKDADAPAVYRAYTARWLKARKGVRREQAAAVE